MRVLQLKGVRYGWSVGETHWELGVIRLTKQVGGGPEGFDGGDREGGSDNKGLGGLHNVWHMVRNSALT